MSPSFLNYDLSYCYCLVGLQLFPEEDAGPRTKSHGISEVGERLTPEACPLQKYPRGSGGALVHRGSSTHRRTRHTRPRGLIGPPRHFRSRPAWPAPRSPLRPAPGLACGPGAEDQGAAPGGPEKRSIWTF